MIRNYLKTAFRNIWRNKFFSIINIVGLSIGLAGSFFLLLYVINETGYNKCHKKRHNVYRIIEYAPDYKMMQPKAPFQMAEVMLAVFPEIEKVTRIGNVYQVAFQKGDDMINEHNVRAADPSVFDIFTLPIISGNKDVFLTEPGSIVISRKIAEKYFADQQAIGKEMVMQMDNETYTFRVDGVMENMPEKSTFRAEILCHTNMIYERQKQYFPKKSDFTAWTWAPCETYLLLPDKHQPSLLEDKFPDLVKNYVVEHQNIVYSLQSLNDIYFHSQNLSNAQSWGDLKSIYTFSAVALLILIVACANYIILSTAQSFTRFKEMGMRKVVGASRNELINQILLESVLLSIMALPVSIILMEISLPFMNGLVGVQLKLWDFENYQFFTGLVIITLVVGVLSGLYVAIFLSKFNPVLIIGKTGSMGNAKSYMRSTMIVVQMLAFSVLIIVLQTISSQIDFAKNSDLGYNNEDLLKIETEIDFRPHISEFLSALQTNPKIINASAANYTPPEMGWQKVQYLHPSIPHQKVTVEEISVDYNFVETLELKLLQGRSFSKDYAMDATNAAILSESAVEHFGLTNPVGSTIQQSEKESLQVIGVIADINMRSMKQGFMPLVLRMTEDNLYEVVVRFAPGTFDKTITFLEEKMKMFNTKNPMDFITAKDYTNYLYRKEAKLKKILGTFMLLAAFISIMGLFALSLFMVRQKTKIIGIHKVFGASLKDIIRLLLSNFLVLVLIANIIAWPLGWYLSNRWLQEYSFRVGFSIQGYLIALLASVLLVAITVLINAIRAARACPVDSLKYE